MVTEAAPTETPPPVAALTPSEATEAPSDAPTPEPTSTTETTEEVTPEAPEPYQWGDTDFGDDSPLWTHDAVKSRLDTERETSKNAGRDAAIEEFLPHVQANSQKVQAVTEATQKLLTQFNRTLKNDPNALDDFMDNHPEIIPTLQNLVDGAYFEMGKVPGRQIALLELAKAAGDDSIASPFMSRLNSLASGIPDTTWAKDFVRKLTDKVDKDGYERGQKAGYEKGKADAAEVAKTRARANGGGPNLAPERTSGASISTLAEAERRYNLPTGHRDKIEHAAFKEAAKRFGATYI